MYYFTLSSPSKERTVTISYIKKIDICSREIPIHHGKWYQVFEIMLSFLYFTDKPHNPMVNAGAIVVTSLIKVKCWQFLLT